MKESYVSAISILAYNRSIRITRRKASEAVGSGPLSRIFLLRIMALTEIISQEYSEA
jgi:hypothetical protein